MDFALPAPIRPVPILLLAVLLTAGGCATLPPPDHSRDQAVTAMQAVREGKTPAGLLKGARAKLNTARQLERQHRYALARRLYEQVVWDIDLARSQSRTRTLIQEREALEADIAKLKRALEEAGK